MTGAAVDEAARHDTVVLGASAGGVETLQRFVAALAPDLPLAFLVVLHIAPQGSYLPEILTRAGTYEALHPKDGDPIVAGRILVAPPDLHLIVGDGIVHLSRDARHQGARPGIDPLFESAARARGPRVIGIILSGSLHDGAAGLAAVKARGGLTIVQDPAEAKHPSMPEAAIAATEPAHVLPVASIAALLGNVAAAESVA
jgi:two-component system, chemotaxis family, protein-glutamate methylesterase/glutaminase